MCCVRGRDDKLFFFPILKERTEAHPGDNGGAHIAVLQKKKYGKRNSRRDCFTHRNRVGAWTPEDRNRFFHHNSIGRKESLALAMGNRHL